MKAPMQQPLPDVLSQLLEQARVVNLQRLEQGEGFTPQQMRDNLAAMTQRYVTRVPAVSRVIDTVVGGSGATPVTVPVRLYLPDDRTAAVLVFAHGGGHMAGSVAVYDAIARKLALASGRIVISVDYRLAPEHPYPAGLDDLVQVIRGAYPLLDAHGLDHRRELALAGDSGGGALVASAVHRLAAEADVHIGHQVLIYPSLDYTLSCDSVDSLAQGYLLEKARIEWLFEQYLQHAEDRRAVSPLFMPLQSDWPHTLLITAGYCPLRDEGMAYAQRLSEAGHVAELLHFPDMIHAFLNMEDLVPQPCARFYQAVGRFLAAPSPATEG